MIALGIVLGVILLIALTPVGALFRYSDKTELKLIVGPFRIQLIPAKPKTRKQLEKQERKKAKKAAKKAEQKKKAAQKVAAKVGKTVTKELTRGLLGTLKKWF